MPPETAHPNFPQCNRSRIAATTVRTVATLPLTVRPVRSTSNNRQSSLAVEQVRHTAQNPDRLAPREVLPIQFADGDA